MFLMLHCSVQQRQLPHRHTLRHAHKQQNIETSPLSMPTSFALCAAPNIYLNLKFNEHRFLVLAHQSEFKDMKIESCG
jgi:hypothetical protein